MRFRDGNLKAVKNLLYANPNLLAATDSSGRNAIQRYHFGPSNMRRFLERMDKFIRKHPEYGLPAIQDSPDYSNELNNVVSRTIYFLLHPQSTSE